MKFRKKVWDHERTRCNEQVGETGWRRGEVGAGAGMHNRTQKKEHTAENKAVGTSLAHDDAAASALSWHLSEPVWPHRTRFAWFHGPVRTTCAAEQRLLQPSQRMRGRRTLKFIDPKTVSHGFMMFSPASANHEQLTSGARTLKKWFVDQQWLGRKQNKNQKKRNQTANKT